MIITTFKVMGRGVFPFDMLRYDHCWPDTSEDAANLAPHEPQHSRTITLRAWGGVGGWLAMTPTAERWSSFGWTVVDYQKRRA